MDNLPRRNNRVVVIGATNALDAVDPSFLRPGRFTYVIEVKRPGEAGLAEILLICLEVAASRALRTDFLDDTLQKAVLAPRQQWLEKAFQRDETGVARVAREAACKEFVGDDVREVVRRIIDERVLAAVDGIDLGPITVGDLQRHVEEYMPVAK
jgi:SpoVK/Ycf46/Vps4 family AAA+-type ATPase